MSTTAELALRAMDFGNILASEGGVVDDVFVEQMEAFLNEGGDKLNRNRHVINGLEATMATIDAEVKRLQTRKRELSRRRDWLKARSLDLFEEMRNLPEAPVDPKNENRLVYDTYNVSKITTKALGVEDEDAFVERWAGSAYVRTKTTTAIDRAAVLKALKSDKDVEGATIVDGATRLQFS